MVSKTRIAASTLIIFSDSACLSRYVECKQTGEYSMNGSQQSPEGVCPQSFLFPIAYFEGRHNQALTYPYISIQYHRLARLVPGGADTAVFATS